jgi:biotin operon repressor
MTNKKYYQKVLKLLSSGKEEAIPMETLARVLAVNPREIRQAILDARRDGIVVCSGTEGYYFPKSDEEVLKYYRINHARAMTTLASLKATRKLIKQMEVNSDE